MRLAASGSLKKIPDLQVFVCVWDRLQQEITSSVTLGFLSPLNPRPIKDRCGFFTVSPQQ